jgi:hypothetical protein
MIAGISAQLLEWVIQQHGDASFMQHGDSESIIVGCKFLQEVTRFKVCYHLSLSFCQQPGDLIENAPGSKDSNCYGTTWSRFHCIDHSSSTGSWSQSMIHHQHGSNSCFLFDDA